MKTFLKLLICLFIVAIGSCKKSAGGYPGYASTTAFYETNGVPMQEYTINAVTGGSFTTLQGTVVNIPPNAFVTQSNVPVTGNVTVQFKDIYKKSDMLLSDMGTKLIYGPPLKSGGEFFIKVNSGASAVDFAPGKKIEVNQPVANTGGVLDSAMLAVILLPDSAGGPAWWYSQVDSVIGNASNYVFSLYQFNSPLESGSWCNSDNAAYFNAYPLTTLTIHPNDDPALYQQDVFLVFRDISTMIHVYSNATDFPYYYAPVGLQCTVVALGVKDGQLYSSFTPITIGSNQTVNFTLSPTTTGAFKTQLETLN
jgi:hypothetical protein